MRITLDTMENAQDQSLPRGIAVVDVGFTNTKVILYDAALNVLAERKITSPHHDGRHYREIDVGPILAFATTAIQELDAVAPVDAIVPSAHGACIVTLKADGTPAVPVMDYMSEPPAGIVADYRRIMPDFAESYSPLLPMALMHAMQLYWQSRVLSEDFAHTRTILPLMQYIAFGLGGRAVSEISSMSCQSHLVDMRSGRPSSLGQSQGWGKLYAPEAKAWEGVGTFNGKRDGFQGRGQVLAGVHDSNANFLRYLAAGQSQFSLLSTGTWVIGFDTDSDMLKLDHARDIVANKSVFGKTVASCRFFGGKEFEMLAGDAPGADIDHARYLCLALLHRFRWPHAGHGWQGPHHRARTWLTRGKGQPRNTLLCPHGFGIAGRPAQRPSGDCRWSLLAERGFPHAAAGIAAQPIHHGLASTRRHSRWCRLPRPDAGRHTAPYRRCHASCHHGSG
jgi:catechol 2,3-dioxygenase-like lactoylglutathione lyase family enzyme